MSDHFTRLGLPRRFLIDAGELERAYLDRSRAVHPDYHLAASDAELAASLELSAGLNAAYNTLRDPFARADYLLGLYDVPADPNAKLSPAFLAEMLEARERVAAAAGRPDEVARLKAGFDRDLAALGGRLAGLFERYDSLAADDPARANLGAELRGLLSQARYVRRLVDDLLLAD